MSSEGDRAPASLRRPSEAGPRQLLLVGVNHRTSRLDEREKLLRRATYARLRRVAGSPPPWEDVVLLATCNRIEAYAVSATPRTAAETICRAFEIPPDSPALYVLRDLEAAAHLFRVASGLDSLAQGEAQVTAQVRRTPSERPKALQGSRLLADPFERAARAAPRIRSLAGLDEVDASASHAALRYLRTSVPIPHPTVALLGTGKMARIAAASLRGTAQILVANRDRNRAREVARDLGGRGLGLDALDRILETADVVLAATGSRKPLLSSHRLGRALAHRDGRPLWLIDLGFPRNIDPACGHLPGVTLVDIDALAPWGAQPLPPAALARAEEKIRDEAGRVVASLQPSGPEDIAALRKAAEQIRRTEVEEALERLPGLDDADRAVVDKLATRLVNRFLHGPTERLRSLPEDTRAEIVRELMRGLGGETR